MTRVSKKKEVEEQKVPEMETVCQEQPKGEVEEQKATNVEITPQVEKLMRLYPQYEQIYITKDGFVHPFGAPQYLIADATLYKNKYYKNK